MMRELAPLVAVGLVAFPDGATAFFGRRLFQRCYAPPAPLPVYHCPPVVLAPPCLPAFPVYGLPAPTYAAPAEVVPPAQPTPAVPPSDGPKTPRVSVTPERQPVRPAANAAPAVAASPPEPKADLRVEPKPVSPPGAGFDFPDLKPSAPQMGGNSLNIPPTAVPGGSATPSPTRVADKPASDTGDLPPLSLFGEGRVAKSSPLRARPAFDLYPAAGRAAEGAVTRAVDFTNLSGRAVTLTVEGRSVELPDRSTVSATVTADFRWALDGGEAVASRVPEGAPGADVVLRR